MDTSLQASAPSWLLVEQDRLRRRHRLSGRTTLLLLGVCLLPAVGRASVPQALHPLTTVSPSGKQGDQRKEVDQLEKQWRNALLAGDNAVLGSLLADSYVGIGPDGTIMSKNEELQARASGQEHLERLEVDDRKIRIYGTTAVVTSKAKVQGVYFGQPLLGEYRYTRVWSLTHGQWRIVSFESNRVHDTSARSR